MFQGIYQSNTLVDMKLITCGNAALAASSVQYLALASFQSGVIQAAVVAAAKTRTNPIKKKIKKNMLRTGYQ